MSVSTGAFPLFSMDIERGPYYSSKAQCALLWSQTRVIIRTEEIVCVSEWFMLCLFLLSTEHGFATRWTLISGNYPHCQQIFLSFFNVMNSPFFMFQKYFNAGLWYIITTWSYHNKLSTAHRQDWGFLKKKIVSKEQYPWVPAEIQRKSSP